MNRWAIFDRPLRELSTACSATAEGAKCNSLGPGNHQVATRELQRSEIKRCGGSTVGEGINLAVIPLLQSSNLFDILYVGRCPRLFHLAPSALAMPVSTVRGHAFA